MSDVTIKVAITEEEVDSILDGCRTTAAICEPDPRNDKGHMEYLKGGLSGEALEEHVRDLCESWDERYAFLKKWERRKDRLVRKAQAQ